MIRVSRKSIAISLAALMAMSTFAGCAKTNKDQSNAGGTTTQQNGQVYPLAKASKITFWKPVSSNWVSYAQNYGDTEIAKEMSKRTGVQVEYVHPPQGQEKDVFNILVASGDLPDVIQYKWTDFPGGPAAAINNNIIIKLNDAMSKWSPNLSAFLKDHQVYDKEMKMDDGSYYFYPLFRDGKELLHTSGPIIRKDWLDADGLAVPETHDEWYTVLKAFKEKNGATAPLTAIGTKDALQVLQMLEGSFSTYQGFYLKDGKVVYGYATPEYKNMLTYLNKLYSEGLLDKNFTSTDTKAQASNMLNGKSGITYGAGGGNLGVWIPSGQQSNPKYDLVAAKFPVQKKGDTPQFVNFTSGVDRTTQIAITAKCKDVETAARFLDYGFSKEGDILENYGIEGTSYTNVNGVPTYTDLITKNPNKLSFAQALANYTNVSSSHGALRQDVGYIKQYYSLPQQQNALKVWSDTKDTVFPLLTPTDAESAEIAKITSDTQTYTMEMTVKFIMGQEPLTNFDSYVNNLKKMNIDRAIALEQQALDRYNKR